MENIMREKLGYDNRRKKTFFARPRKKAESEQFSGEEVKTVENFHNFSHMRRVNEKVDLKRISSWDGVELVAVFYVNRMGESRRATWC